ncbi:MAG: hypothetical protein QM817_40735 [Archangium sp.]
MPRTPLPKDVAKRSFDIEVSLDEWLTGLTTITGRNWIDCFNAELDFVRRFGLLPQLARRLELEAARKNSSLQAEVQELIYAAALALPAAASTQPGTIPTKRRRTSGNISGPNWAFLSSRVEATQLEFSDVVNRELLFAKTLGLTPALMARLDAAAERRGISTRDHVTELLLVAAQKLPEAPPIEPAASIWDSVKPRKKTRK